MMPLSPSLEARVRASTLLARVEQALLDEDYGPATAADVAELRRLEEEYGLKRLFDGLPAYLDRYSVLLTAWRELS
jgi:hypothetical protein